MIKFKWTDLPFDIRKNFEYVRDFINSFSLYQGRFKFFTIAVPAAATQFKFKHNLGFRPTDVLQTSLISPNDGTLVWNYNLFDDTYVYLTTTEALTVRAFIGAYIEEASAQ